MSDSELELWIQNLQMIQVKVKPEDGVDYTRASKVNNVDIIWNEIAHKLYQFIFEETWLENVGFYRC